MIHVVEKGDTIRRIAERYGSTVTAIVAANPNLADPDQIRPGQELTVPNGDAGGAQDSTTTPAPTSRPAAKPAVTSYTVAAGDTLGKVAKAFGITVSELLAANPQITNPDVVRRGQVVTIPRQVSTDHPVATDSSAAEPAAPRNRPTTRRDTPKTKPATSPETTAARPRTYTVASGDTLGKVAKAFGVALPDLIAANPQITNPDVVKRGEVLAIPTGASSPPPTPSGPEPDAGSQPGVARTRTDWPRVPVDQRMLYVMERLVAAGYPVNGAAGILGNLYVESGVLPNRLERSSSKAPMRAPDFSGAQTDFTPEEVMGRDERARRGPRYKGVGLAQWTAGRRRSGLFGHEYQGEVLGPEILFDMDAQVDYLVTELRGWGGVQRKVADPAVTVEDAADEILYEFERPGSIIAGGKRLPRLHPRVQEVFAERREPARRALRVWRKAHPG